MYITIALYVCNYLIYIKHPHLFAKYNTAIGGVLFLCLYIDYRLLQINTLYLQSLLMSVAILAQACLLHTKFNNPGNFASLLFGASVPFLFLVLQKILRSVFILLLKREPFIEKRTRFQDKIYQIILLLGPFILAIVFAAYASRYYFK